VVSVELKLQCCSLINAKTRNIANTEMNVSIIIYNSWYPNNIGLVALKDNKNVERILSFSLGFLAGRFD